jgi:hypothetical protein
MKLRARLMAIELTDEPIPSFTILPLSLQQYEKVVAMPAGRQRMARPPKNLDRAEAVVADIDRAVRLHAGIVDRRDLDDRRRAAILAKMRRTSRASAVGEAGVAGSERTAIVVGARQGAGYFFERTLMIAAGQGGAGGKFTGIGGVAIAVQVGRAHLLRRGGRCALGTRALIPAPGPDRRRPGGISLRAGCGRRE